MSPVERPGQPARPDGGVQVIARAAEIMRLLRRSPGGLTQAELMEELGLARTTVHRILAALETAGFVTSGRSRGRFRLGPEIARLAEAARHTLILDLRPYLEELSRTLNETVDLSVLDHDQVLFIDQVVAPQRLRAVSAVGVMFPAYCCANGKALLARLPDERISELLPDPLPALTPSTITRRERMIAELAGVRADGVAFDREEHTVGISAVGSVVTGSPWGTAAISVPMPTQRFAGRESEVAATLTEMTSRIEATFNGSPG